MPEIDVGMIPKWLPRFFGLLSFIFNPLLIYLVMTQNKCKIGPYRQFLVCFALFDMTYSAVDVFVGMASHHYESSFSVFVSHGPLVDNPAAGKIGLTVRCAFVCLSYGILEIHFIYRYISLCRPKLLHWFTQPLYIVGWFIFWLSFGIYWAFAMSLAYLDEEDIEFLRDSFLDTYNVNIDDIGIIGIRYKATNPRTILRTSAGMLMGNIISVAVITSYCVMGNKINKLLKESTISTAAKRVHRQLFLALVAQTVIPFVVSFLPCCVPVYGPQGHKFDPRPDPTKGFKKFW
ncbi:unnamed protein product [Caenorhabditis auriculariae]|uniref:G protein-coupled receptor n=1 Tax=Caenorhabditis auriculariae TaxID=2777116 RepID=A0A8S1HKL1_9PELO|nr:unnamed protein product [Caenorhabditis auriculariae]